MDNEWLQLTEQDIERAERLAAGRTAPAGNVAEPVTIRTVGEPGPGSSTPRYEAPIKIRPTDLRPQGPVSQISPNLSALERLTFALINETRSKHLPVWIRTASLAWNEEVAAVARGHSLDMVNRQYVAHVSPEGIGAANRISKQGIRYAVCGENIGVYYGERVAAREAVQAIMEAFLEQPRSMTNHRGNLLNPLWTHVGVGIAASPGGSLVVTQTFISAPIARLRER
ncbi:MAG: CAP domain-containing protein [Candidatus Promineifilaceae bacterium]|nr:CAP domain-containing protein [Candidatus Promineifilaceae bacterium]